MGTQGNAASTFGEGLRNSLSEAQQKARELVDRAEVPTALSGLTQNLMARMAECAVAGREQAGWLAQRGGDRFAGLDQELRARLEAELPRLRDYAESGGGNLASYFKATLEVDKTTAQMVDELREHRMIPAASIDDVFEQCKREAFRRTLDEFFHDTDEGGGAAAVIETGPGRIRFDPASGALVIGERPAPSQPPAADASPPMASPAPDASPPMAPPAAPALSEAKLYRLAQQLVGLMLLETIDLFVDEIRDIAVRGTFADEHGLIAGIHARRERLAGQLHARFTDHQIWARARAAGLEGGIDGVLGAIQQILIAHLVKTPLHMLSMIRVCTQSMVRCTRVLVGDGERKFDDMRLIMGGAATGVMRIHVADAIAKGVAVVPLLSLYSEKVAAVLTEMIVTTVPLGAVYVFERNKARFAFRATSD